MPRILITGACGQIGSELTVELSRKYGRQNIIATDVKKAVPVFRDQAEFRFLDVLNPVEIDRIIVEQNIDWIFHMAAILSATGEKNPNLAFDVNMNGLLNILEGGRRHNLERIITPSSIAAFGPDAPKENTPDDTVLNPTSMYGVTKVAGEKLIQYYNHKYEMDIRSLRYPGIISSETLPGGGTTDFAVDIYLQAVHGKPYVCYISEKTRLPFMYMPDAINSIIQLAEAENHKLTLRTYNVHAMSLTPAQLNDSVREYFPNFKMSYQPDYRQQIADSWPFSLDDSKARQDWGWQAAFNLKEMTRDMVEKLKKSAPHPK